MPNLRRESALKTVAVVVLAGLVAAPSAAAQLRPLDPLRWDGGGGASEVRLGAGVFKGQRASLAGTRGRLVELGTYTATVRMGRVRVELGGTALRLFADDSVYSAPVAGARPPNGRHRVDTGEHRLGTVVRLTSSDTPLAAAVRFGVRLPTTDNLEGLGRDQTDFYATLAGRWRLGRADLTAEAGVGVYGTRDPAREQVDPLLFAAGVGWDVRPVRLHLEAVGQHDTRRGAALRGIEDLGELRLSAGVGERRRLGVTLVRGIARHSPDLGLVVESAIRF